MTPNGPLIPHPIPNHELKSKSKRTRKCRHPTKRGWLDYPSKTCLCDYPNVVIVDGRPRIVQNRVRAPPPSLTRPPVVMQCPNGRTITFDLRLPEDDDLREILMLPHVQELFAMDEETILRDLRESAMESRCDRIKATYKNMMIRQNKERSRPVSVSTKQRTVRFAANLTIRK